MSDEERAPVRPIALGGPHRGPALMWTARGAATGQEPPPRVYGQPALDLLFWLLWRLAGLLALPVLLLLPRARRHILGVPAPEPGHVWLHGASLGEHAAATALAPHLGPGVWRTSSSWRTPVAGALPAPLDLPFVAARWLDRARPRLIVLIEAELWPGWIHAARRRGIPVVVVNARQGRGTARLRRFGPLWRFISGGVRFIGQDETGDLKLAATVRAATFQLGRDALIAASTRPGDEAAMLAGWGALPSPRPLLVLAPRHLDRVPEVVGLLENANLAYVRRTALDEGEGLTRAEVLLLDTLGELASLYPQARAAFIGGTFDPALGGHSPAEAFAAGLPVVHGPHTHSNPVAFTAGIALQVTGPGELGKALRSALAVGPRPAPVSEAAARGAALMPEGHIPPETPARPWLAPLVPLWAAGVRRALDVTPTRVGVPVVSVGALVAGGAGKTPAAAWLAERLPGAWVVARGYRRGAEGPVVRVGGERGDLGDELELLWRRGVSVVSSPDRVAGARAAIERGARLVLLDDGFQHRALHRDLDVVCIDSRWPDGRGPIPVGARREPWSALGRAGWLWWSHGPPPDGLAARVGEPQVDHLPAVTAIYEPDCWLHRGARRDLLDPAGPASGRPVAVIAGLARPEGFLSQLVALGVNIASWSLLPDHAPLHRVPPGAVLSEKDAARLPADADVWALRVRLRVTGGERLLAAIRALEPA